MSAIEALAARGRERLGQLGLEASDEFAAALGYSEFLYRLLTRLGSEAGTTLLAAARRPLTTGRLRELFAASAGLVPASEHGLALIALRETAGLASTRASLLAASALAETAVAAACGDDGEALSALSGCVVFGLGKLGGRELNFYSDLDLVLAAPAGAGERDEERRLQAARRLISRLEGGWRIDLRLRPFGGAGALVMSFPAMETYFQHHGREWERYAWIKARPVGGDRRAGREFLTRLHPFIYRRYLDYHAIEALREMKRQIVEEAGVNARDIKRGAGGIREIEFIVQAFQLVRGGREAGLATPRLRGALAAVRRLALLDAEDAHSLRTAYDFLRRVENRLQIERLMPEHRLPAGTARRLRLAASLGYPDWPPFADDLERHRGAVRRIFDAVFGLPAASVGRGPAERLWRGDREDDEPLALARDLGFGKPAESVAALTNFKGARGVRLMSTRARVALDRVAPELILAAATQSDPDAALERLLGLLAGLTRRSAYLALLAERPQARDRLASMVGASPWIARRLAANPVALDELLDPRLASPAGRGRLAREFAGVLALATEPDLASERFREIIAVQRLKIAAGLAAGSLAAARAELDLSLLGERAVRTALALAGARMRERHGALSFELLAIGYGKLGSRELGLASDLDLVFVYDTPVAQSAGGLAAEVYLARLAQRAISLLSEPTALGSLYAVDTRLRPEGAAGLLISRYAAWRRYQHEQAWLWERQALLRARPIAGSGRLARAFRKERLALLARPVDGPELGGEIVAMRARVAAAGETRTERTARLLDGEFLAAWWLIEAAHDCPRALSRCGLGAQLEALAACGTTHPARELAAALAALRAAGDRAVLGLAGEPDTGAEAGAWVAEQWAAASG